MMTLVFATLTFFIGGGAPPACAADGLLVTVERDGEAGLEQLAIIFKEDGAELVTNSNFMGKARPFARLGRFQSPLTVRLRTARLRIEAVRDRAARAGAPTKSDFHGLRCYIGELELEPGSSFYGVVWQTLGEAWEMADWAPVSAIRLTWVSRDVIRVEKQGENASTRKAKPAELGCKSLGARSLACWPQGFGRAYLRL